MYKHFFNAQFTNWPQKLATVLVVLAIFGVLGALLN